ncbi:hypothetical protein D3C73_1009390 [compost metagenome]
MKCRICRRCRILQIIRSIMPTSTRIDMGAIGNSNLSCIKRKSIMCMAAIFQKRVKQCPLLPHITQYKICRSFVNVPSNSKCWRLHITSLNKKASCILYRREIKTKALNKRTISPIIFSDGMHIDCFTRFCVFNFKRTKLPD